MTAALEPAALTAADVTAAAYQWHQAGFCVLPVKADGSKAPDVTTWTRYQREQSTDRQIKAWFGNHKRAGLGIVCGAVSGGLEMFELEGRCLADGARDKLVPALEAAGVLDVWRRLVNGYAEWTPSGGLHLLYRLADREVPGNTKVAQRPARENELDDREREILRKNPDKIFRRVLAETRGEGGFVVAAPSHGTTHSSGRPWVLAKKAQPGRVPTISWDERVALFAAVHAVLDETPEPEPVQPRSQLTRGEVGERPGDVWAAQTDWSDILTPHGWHHVYRRGDMDFWRRPGKDIGWSARTGGRHDGLYVWSTSTEFPTEVHISKFRAHAILNHGGNDSAAASDLRRLGYGGQPDERRLAPSPAADPAAGGHSAEHAGWPDGTVPERPADEGEQPSHLDRLRAALVDSAGLDNIPDPDPLVGADILFRDCLAWMVGKPGCMKSFTALDLAGCVATGETWQGYQVSQGPVLYLVAEGVRGIKKRVRAWEQSMGRRMGGVYFLPVAVQSKNASQWAALVDLASELRPALVVVDTQARVTVGVEENSNTEMGEFVHQAEKLRAASAACVLIVHHIGRNGDTGRGATTLDGALSTVIKVTKDEDRVKLECQKNKDGTEWEPIELRAVPTGDSLVLMVDNGATQPKANSAASRKWVREWWSIFEADPMTPAKLMATLGVAESTFYRTAKELIDASAAAKEGRGSATRYRLLHAPTPT
ncbi:AAA family ATPase [Micromonospora sp. 4G57]|uniref:AAA family ATPase n=1 Tax=Micromonospora sicca TaxID=2202420 RepID=A0ABU5JAR1_9ACTN|nr:MULTISPECIES: AAA family ATPase [unclassified Micromonospora]MDZ5443800.1 AAA family ATPase [Micromonospora sp. 4G57]MDZ5489682.1 AAA family ATPase [Micromonospora sp. 4G53]